ncbi:hypothetical protein [Rudaeicoccus suwonensis]|nr:hypothetical protein [Rudaeicoccus suwonensis]
MTGRIPISPVVRGGLGALRGRRSRRTAAGMTTGPGIRARRVVLWPP